MMFIKILSWWHQIERMVWSNSVLKVFPIT
jgi:hypothetical protein